MLKIWDTIRHEQFVDVAFRVLGCDLSVVEGAPLIIYGEWLTFGATKKVWATRDDTITIQPDQLSKWFFYCLKTHTRQGPITGPRPPKP